MRPAVRISFGIVALSASVLLIADTLLGIFPDPDAAVIEARQDLSESLAVQYSALVGVNRQAESEATMEALVAQMPDVLSMSLRTLEGHELAGTTEHASLWKRVADSRSTPTHVQVPIFRGSERWGTLEVRFDELPGAGLMGLLNTPLYKLLAVMSVAGFVAYLLYLSRTLRHLDPSSVIPERVRAALDQLVEGVFILDNEQRIVLANRAFAQNFDCDPDAMMGVDPAKFTWVNNERKSTLAELPWVTSMRDGARRTAVRLELKTRTSGVRVFNCNVSPIGDGSDNVRGILASLDDVSEVEKMNRGLKETLQKLELANSKVHDKNEELEVLASIDYLTGCLNRRSFFEKLKLEFKLAKRDKLELSVVMADIDLFKVVNDEFGHSAGDAVIQDMAGALKTSLRASDCVGRYGGEEFCILLVGASPEVAERVSERARVAFETCSQSSGSATAGRKVTASFGLSTLADGAADAEAMLDQADQALYSSKRHGRNRITHWSDLDEAQRAVS